MDELKNRIIERTGLDPETADKVIDAVMGFLKDNPEQLTGLLGDKDQILGKLKGLFG